ncbi:MAG: hypothetical protein HY875_02365 [Chloroflexi bacterium]|nr:hypothetical protein [Chloroflexota bacterium]
MRDDDLAYVAFAAFFLVCTVVAVGFVLIAWLGLAFGLAWIAAVAPFAVFLLILLRRYSAPGRGRGPGR